MCGAYSERRLRLSRKKGGSLHSNERVLPFCIKCGAKRGGKPFFGLLCIDCKEFNLKLPKAFDVEVCRRCGRFRLGNEWTYEVERLEEKLEGKIKGEHTYAHVHIPEDIEELREKREVEVSLFYNSDKGPVEKKVSVPVKVKVVLCQECSRISGGYYEGIIQLRGDPEQVRRWANILYSALWKKSFVSKVEELKEGIDLYFGSSREALKVVKDFGLPYKLSRKLYGMKEGKRVYRLTIAIRFSKDEEEKSRT